MKWFSSLPSSRGGASCRPASWWPCLAGRSQSAGRPIRQKRQVPHIGIQEIADRVADGELGHALTDLDDRPRRLVAEHAFGRHRRSCRSSRTGRCGRRRTPRP